jgi:hypothetical protein
VRGSGQAPIAGRSDDPLPRRTPILQEGISFLFLMVAPGPDELREIVIFLTRGAKPNQQVEELLARR